MTDPFVSDLHALNMPIHVVLDGAIVDSIEDRLTAHGLAGRPLFRETAHRETVLAGPWLVSAGRDHATLARAAAAARSIGGGVFWLGEPDADVLFRHLRRLNAARMPDDRILYFRHYDSDVLASIVPLLDAEQAARLFGPARMLGFVGGRGDNMTVTKQDGLPEPGSGPLPFADWQIEALDERQREISRWKIVRMIRQDLPDEARHQSDQKLYESVASYEADGKEIGITSERAHAEWAYLTLYTKGMTTTSTVFRSNLMYMSDRFNQSVDIVLHRDFQKIKSDYLHLVGS